MAKATSIKGFWFGKLYVRVPDGWDVMRLGDHVYVRRRDAHGHHRYWARDDGHEIF